MQCFEKARSFGESEDRVILPRLARLHVELGKKSLAAKCFEDLNLVLAHLFEESEEEEKSEILPELSEARVFLMKHYRENGTLPKNIF